MNERETKITEAYKDMLIADNEEVNPYTLSRKVGITEKEFFQSFSSVDDIARKVWHNLGDSVIEALNGSELYNSYPPRQKILSYYFTFFELALNERTFIERTFQNSSILSEYRDLFKSYLNDVVQEGIATEDIKERLTMSSYYPNILWDLHTRLVEFWLKDQSANFVETEKAVEIYCRVPLELMGPNLFDSMYETLKFNLGQFKLDKIFG